jgi:hypothetical protein
MAHPAPAKAHPAPARAQPALEPRQTDKPPWRPKRTREISVSNDEETRQLDHQNLRRIARGNSEAKTYRPEPRYTVADYSMTTVQRKQYWREQAAMEAARLASEPTQEVKQSKERGGRKETAAGPTRPKRVQPGNQLSLEGQFELIMASVTSSVWRYPARGDVACTGCSITDESTQVALKAVIDFANSSLKVKWADMFRDTDPHGNVRRDRYRQQADVAQAADSMALEAQARAMKEVHRLMLDLCTVLRGTSKGNEHIWTAMWSIIRSKPWGTWNEVLKRTQRFHKDCHAALRREFGKAHSLFVTASDARNLLVKCVLTGETRLLQIPPYHVILLHGRWTHAGVGLPGSEGTTPKYVLFAYVMMEPENTDSARFVNYHERMTKQDNMESVMLVLTEMVAETQFSSLEWTPPGTTGVCSQCGNSGRILHPDTEARNSCFECMQYGKAAKKGEREQPKPQIKDTSAPAETASAPVEVEPAPKQGAPPTEIAQRELRLQEAEQEFMRSAQKLEATRRAQEAETGARLAEERALLAQKTYRIPKEAEQGATQLELRAQEAEQEAIWSAQKLEEATRRAQEAETDARLAEERALLAQKTYRTPKETEQGALLIKDTIASEGQQPKRQKRVPAPKGKRDDQCIPTNTEVVGAPPEKDISEQGKARRKVARMAKTAKEAKEAKEASLTETCPSCLELISKAGVHTCDVCSKHMHGWDNCGIQAPGTDPMKRICFPCVNKRGAKKAQPTPGRNRNPATSKRKDTEDKRKDTGSKRKDSEDKRKDAGDQRKRRR